MGTIVRRRFLSLIGAVLISITFLLSRGWVVSERGKSHEHLNPTTYRRESVTLRDERYTYHLNMSQFRADFPHLQTYNCSVKLPPRTQPKMGNPKPTLIMAIKSHPGSTARRQAARQTWARGVEVDGYSVRPIFLIAQAESWGQMELVRLESQEFGDILQWDFTEGHHNLSLKERCFLEWLNLNVPEVEFIFKGDDDEYANPEALVLYAREHDAFPQTLHGHIQYDTRVMREAKYRISETLYPFHRFPLFLSGGGFMFPGTSVLPLYQASQKLPVFPLDDVYVGFLSLAANLTYRNDARFIVVRREFNPCLYKLALVVHGIQSDELVKIWKEVQNACCKAAPPNGKC
uniref:Hexosyltransferase n=1 Tax=Xenopus tropicalis TaxID=8364 RepID=A0A803JV71_XENTR